MEIASQSDMSKLKGSKQHPQNRLLPRFFADGRSNWFTSRSPKIHYYSRDDEKRSGGQRSERLQYSAVILVIRERHVGSWKHDTKEQTQDAHDHCAR